MQRMAWVACVGIAAFVLSCASPPVEELMQAESALQEAQAAGAEDYASDAFKSAAEAMADARSKNERKDFDGARAAAVDAKVKADLSRAVIAEAKASAKEEVETAVTTQREAWENVTLAASKIKLAMANKKRMVDLTTRIEGLQSAIKSMVDTGDFVGARDLIRRVDEEIGQARVTIASDGTEKR